MTRLVAHALSVALLVGLTGCPDNPYKASTWTKHLDDPKEAERAVTQLEQLGDPSAIPALGNAWASQGKPVRLLQVIIALARPLTPAEAKATFMTDYEKSGRPANWNRAEPFLIKALVDVDESNPRSVDSAQKAADALGESRLPGALDGLIEIAQKPVSKKLIAAQVAAIRAIGKYNGDKGKASAALLKILDRDPPDHPRTAKDKEQGRALEEKFGLHLGVTGASINALSELRASNAAKTLVLSMYRTPELFTQLRRALAASGPVAKEELRKILRGEHAEVNQLFKDKKLDKYCGDKNDAPPDQCQPVSAKDFYAAVVLGDFYDPEVVPDLLAVLDRPPAPQYFSDDQPSQSTQHNAVFDALRKIGSPKGAEKVRALWAARAKPKKGPAPPGPDLMTRILAVGAYPFLVRDGAGTSDLSDIAADNDADDNLRTEAATAFARLSASEVDIAVLNKLADRYFEESAKKHKEAAGKPKAEADAADKELEKVKAKVDAAKMKVLKVTKEAQADSKIPLTVVKAATEEQKKAEDAYKEAKKVNKAKVAPYKQLESHAKAYKGYARMFQTHISRISVAIRCKKAKDELACYVGTLKQTPEQAATNSTKWIKDIKSWTKDEQLGLMEGEVERAMLEIGKKGAAAGPLTDTLLDAAKSDNRLIRQSILLALPKIAKVPCGNCEGKLDAAIKAGEGKTTLGDLNLETTMLRNYFAWAGGKTPSGPAPVEAAPEAPKAPADKPEPVEELKK